MSARLSYSAAQSRRALVLDLFSAVSSLWPERPTRPPRHRPKARAAPGHIPDWLRNDIGLQPMYEPKSHWDHE